jgi:hypothetical protein
MSRTYEQVKAELDAKLSSDDVSEREGGNGRSLSYVSSYYVIEQLNAILGQGYWSYDTEEMRLVHSGAEEAYGKTKYVAHYVAKVHLIVNIGDKIAQFSDYGYGDGTDKSSAGKAHELAVKEAATDGLKRCAKNLGMKLGLALYEKEQSNVDTGEGNRSAPPQAAASSARSAGGVSTPAPAKNSGGADAARGHSPASTQAPAGKSQEASSVGAAKPSGSAPSGAPAPDRKKVNAAITAISKILLQTEKASMDTMKGILTNTYGVKSKEELNDTQAQEFLAKLEELAK